MHAAGLFLSAPEGPFRRMVGPRNQRTGCFEPLVLCNEAGHLEGTESTRGARCPIAAGLAPVVSPSGEPALPAPHSRATTGLTPAERCLPVRRTARHRPPGTCPIGADQTFSIERWTSTTESRNLLLVSRLVVPYFDVLSWTFDVRCSPVPSAILPNSQRLWAEPGDVLFMVLRAA